MTRNLKTSQWSAGVMNASILCYLIWLLLPAVQTTGRAMTGCACVALFALGAVLDGEKLRTYWLDLLLRAVCAAAMPLILRRFLSRGGENFAGYYVQQAMFWFPLVFAGHARLRGDSRLWKWARWVLLGTVCITVCTTIGWLIQGMLRGGRIYAYSRSLGYAGDVNPAYLKELMLRNIGGYDFVYAMVVALPMTCIAIQRSKGWKRGAFLALIGAQTVMIVLSQYTYAMLYAAAILAAEILALIIRRMTKGRIGTGKSLLLAAVPLVLALLLVQPMAALAARICTSLGFGSFARSFDLLASAFSGGGIAPDSRLAYYLKAAQGFAQSPLLGSITGGEKLLSLHSEVLDLLSGMGLIGTAAVSGLIWLMGRGALRGLRTHPDRAQIAFSMIAFFVIALLGTVNYSRDIMAVFAIGTLLIMEKS